MAVITSSFGVRTRQLDAKPTPSFAVARRDPAGLIVLLSCLLTLAATLVLLGLCATSAHATSSRAPSSRSGLGLPRLPRIAGYGRSATVGSLYTRPTLLTPSTDLVRVRGYWRFPVTPVMPHWRTAPDGNPWNNFSSYGNVNPFTGKRGTKLPYAP